MLILNPPSRAVRKVLFQNVPNYRKQWTHSLCLSCCAELDGANGKSFGLEPPLTKNDLPDLPFQMKATGWSN